MEKLKLNSTEKIATYEIIAILVAIVYHADGGDSVFDLSNFLGGFGIWLAIVLPVLLGIEKLRSDIIWREFLCISMHFVFLGLLGSLTLGTRCFVGVCALSMTMFYHNCLPNEKLKDSVNFEKDSNDAEKLYSTRLLATLIIGGISYFTNNWFLINMSRASCFLLIYYTHLSFYHMVSNWDVNKENTNYFSMKIEQFLRHMSIKNPKKSENLFAEKTNIILLSIFTSAFGLLLGFFIRVLLGNIGN